MPLSDHEQRLLEQMERALYQEDPKFASSLRNGRSGSLDRKRIAIGSLGVLLGLAVVVTGVAVTTPGIGVLGFALMVAGAFWAWTGTRTEGAAVMGAAEPALGPDPRHDRGHASSAFMTKMEQRWRKRREGSG